MRKTPTDVAEVAGSIAPARYLSAADILELEDLELVEVDVPEWKGKVYLRVLSAKEGLDILGELAKLRALPEEEKPNHLTAALRLVLPACIVGKDGTRLFATAEQVDRLLARNHKVLLRLQQAAVELQGWNNEAVAKNGSSGAAPAASRTA